MAIIVEFDEYDHFVTVILVSVILVVSVNLVMKRSFWSWTDGHIGNKTATQVRDNGHFSCELTIISVKITVILVYDNGHFGNYYIGIFGPHRTRTE